VLGVLPKRKERTSFAIVSPDLVRGVIAMAFAKRELIAPDYDDIEGVSLAAGQVRGETVLHKLTGPDIHKDVRLSDRGESTHGSYGFLAIAAVGRPE
jgi:hypothetical protein